MTFVTLEYEEDDMNDDEMKTESQNLLDRINEMPEAVEIIAAGFIGGMKLKLMGINPEVHYWDAIVIPCALRVNAVVDFIDSLTPEQTRRLSE